MQPRATVKNETAKRCILLQVLLLRPLYSHFRFVAEKVWFRPPTPCLRSGGGMEPSACRELAKGFKPRKSQLTMRLSASTAVILNSLRSVP